MIRTSSSSVTITASLHRRSTKRNSLSLSLFVLFYPLTPGEHFKCRSLLLNPPNQVRLHATSCTHLVGPGHWVGTPDTSFFFISRASFKSTDGDQCKVCVWGGCRWLTGGSGLCHFPISHRGGGGVTHVFAGVTPWLRRWWWVQGVFPVKWRCCYFSWRQAAVDEITVRISHKRKKKKNAYNQWLCLDSSSSLQPCIFFFPFFFFCRCVCG